MKREDGLFIRFIIGVPIKSQEVVLDCDTKDDYFHLLAKKSDYVET